MRRKAWQWSVALICGVLFGAGLGLAGMTRPSKVLGFLDLGGDWDPSLAFVMLGAVGVHHLAYRYIGHRTRPLLAERFSVPVPRDVDRRLLAGAALFGIGWGMSGYCPGPALASLTTGSRESLVFVASMILGMGMGSGITRRRRLPTTLNTAAR